MLLLMRRTATFLALVLLVGLAVGGSPGRADALTTPTLGVLLQPEPSAVGRPAFIDAQLEGGQEPEGTITFEVFATSDSECHGSPMGTAIVPVHGDDYYSTGAGGEGEPTIVITALGLYPVRVSYSGDASNAPVSTACGEPTLKINAAPKIALATQEPPVVGEPVQLIANLIGVSNRPGRFVSSCSPRPTKAAKKNRCLTQSAKLSAGESSRRKRFFPAAPATTRLTSSIAEI